MERIRGKGYCELIESAFRIIPVRIADRIRYTHFLCGVDPIYVGLHSYKDTYKGRSLRNTAHVVAAESQRLAKNLRHITVVLPEQESLETVIHELGHVLDYELEFIYTAKPVSKYAKTNRYEAFAESFTSWLLPGYADRPDEATRYLFESLMAT